MNRQSDACKVAIRADHSNSFFVTTQRDACLFGEERSSWNERCKPVRPHLRLEPMPVMMSPALFLRD